MQVLLLLAGRSRRFWPLEDKALWPMCGMPLLAHQIARLQKAGLTDIALVGGAHNLAAAGNIAPGLTLIEQQDLDRGMQGALESALPKLKEGPVMIVSSNDVVDADAYVQVARALQKNVDGVLLGKRVTSYFPGGYLSTDGSRITGIVEKPAPGKEPSDLVTIVVHAHRSPALLLEELRSASHADDDGYERALASLCAKHQYVVAPYEGAWQPVKYPWHLLPLLDELLQTITKPVLPKSASVHPSAVIEGPVVLGENVRVMAHATIVGPCVIGDRTIVGTGSLIRGSSIGRDCVIGFNSEVARSALADHVWTHTTYLGDSIVGRNVSFGSGCITANLRLDEQEISSASSQDKVMTGLTKFGAVVGDHCRLGVRVTIAPGVKIGAHTFISSGVQVEEDIPAESFVRVRDGRMILRENAKRAPDPQEREEFRKKL